MEKRRPHYDLESIKQQMNSVDTLSITGSARNGIKSAKMKLQDAWLVMQGLSMADFYKSMTVYDDHRVWQDVYHADWKGTPLYIKFQRYEDYFIVSFKERNE
ncbi:MAG: type II toxin-antitoxin system MqsR family toxin [Desulfuromonadales bacterium]|nr:type II toxin-antitoxin system MqsR family toxin [Desulfuromonadales bacterium]